ncbi:nucleoside recognition domain-containing protein, partial [Klebsiella pneumoniae]|uniref:nucleoside recognition domain-containing protein n=1 Tax=Klebsiella pneumoniae TaxID=573 RepID=UPI00397078E0
LENITTNWPDFLKALFVGNYGLFSLGLYSFVWAFPVVVLIGLSLSLTDDSGLKERITATLDPWLRKVGLSGQDLIPVLSGFGCNVVAVFQSRSCSRCTRHACISMILSLIHISEPTRLQDIS